MLKKVKKKIRKIYTSCQSLKNLALFILLDLSKIGKADYIFVLPVYHTGGAERVHLNIVKSLREENIVVLFTDNSVTDNFLTSFEKFSDVIEINKILRKNNKFINNFLSKLILYKINKNVALKTVFGSNTDYFYSLIPFIKRNIKKIDLFHAFVCNDHRIDDIVESAALIDFRVVINKRAFDDLLDIYHKNNVEHFQNKIRVIQNAFEIQNQSLKPKNEKEIRIGYLGRWSDEKRLHIFLEVAKKITSIHKNVSFVMAGTGMKSNLKKIEDANVRFLGEISNHEELCNLYNSLNFILITSDREGFPMVITEAMFFGVIPVATNVGGINEHILNQQNGILIKNSDNADLLISNFVFELDLLINDIPKFKTLSANAAEYARLNFGINKFNASYRNLFSS